MALLTGDLPEMAPGDVAGDAADEEDETSDDSSGAGAGEGFLAGGRGFLGRRRRRGRAASLGPLRAADVLQENRASNERVSAARLAHLPAVGSPWPRVEHQGFHEPSRRGRGDRRGEETGLRLALLGRGDWRRGRDPASGHDGYAAAGEEE